MKRSPKKIIESERPDGEHIYLHSPDLELTDISDFPVNAQGVSFDPKKAEEVFKKSHGPYSNLHTHIRLDGAPSAEPSPKDIYLFLSHLPKFSHVVQRDANTGKIEGNTVLQRTRNTKTPTSYDAYWNTLKTLVTDNPSWHQLTGKIAKELNFRVKYIPTKGYEIDSAKGVYVNSSRDNKSTSVPQSRLERASATASILGIIGGAILIFSNFQTSNVSFSPGATPFNWQLWLGIVLILIGLVGGYFWMKGKKENIPRTVSNKKANKKRRK